VSDFEVTKEYREDLGEQDAEGYYDFEYRYWVISFDFRDRTYKARIYTDRPREASIHGPLRTNDEKSQRDLEAMARYLVEVEGVRKVLTTEDPSGKLPMNRKGSYRPVNLGFLGWRRKLRNLLRIK
jgi:hypothetical protein